MVRRMKIKDTISVFGPAMLTLRFTLIVLIGLGFTSCVDYTPAPVSMEQIDHDFAARKLPAQKRAWTVQDFILLSKKYQAGREQTAAQYATAQAALITAGGSMNPAVSLVPGINTSAASNSPSGIPLVSFDLLWETAHKKDLRLLKAQQQVFKAGFALQDTEWQLDAAVRHTGWNLYFTQERQKLLAQEVAAQEKVFDLVKHQLDAGLIAPTEVQSQDLVGRKARLDLADADAAVLEARAQLAEAVGVPAQALERAKMNLTVNPPSPRTASQAVNRVRQVALTHRPDVAMALADYASEEANLALEVAKQYPDIKVSPGYQWDQGNNKWQLGLGFDLPLFHQNQGPIAEATARRREAQSRLEMLQAKISAEVDRVVPALQQAWKTYQVAQDLVKTQEQKKTTAVRRAQAGQGEPMETLLAEVDLISAQLVLVDRANKLAQQLEALEALTRPPLVTAARATPEKNSK